MDLYIWGDMGINYMLKFRCHPIYLVFIAFAFCWHCNSPKVDFSGELQEIAPKYATGFSLWQGDGYWIVEVKKGYASQEKPFRYLVTADGKNIPLDRDLAAKVVLPADRVILTSTTQVPHLDYLEASHHLVAFPDPDLISSEKTRVRIDAGLVEDLGSGAQANIERIIDVQPDWIMISSMGNDLQNLDLLEKAGIPAILNGEYLEQHPLGRAEWILVTGVLLGKMDTAINIFQEIERSYQEAQALVRESELDLPTVLTGVMYQDTWYVPGGESWAAQLLEAAGANYIFSDIPGTASAQLNYEYVLDKGIEANIWIGAADFSSLEKMAQAENRYTQFKAFQTGEVYTYSLKKGVTGGLEYFELGYLRPDWILKDLVKILHPELLPGYEPYFYQKIHAK